MSEPTAPNSNSLGVSGAPGNVNHNGLGNVNHNAQLIALVGGGFLTTAFLLARTVARFSGKSDDPVRVCDTARARWTDAAKKWSESDAALQGTAYDDGNKRAKQPSLSYGRCLELDVEFPVEKHEEWLRKNQYATGNILVM
jgi:hypothetical protein